MVISRGLCRGASGSPFRPPASRKAGIDVPFGLKFRQIHASRLRAFARLRMAEILGDVEADAAGADDGDATPGVSLAAEQIGIGHDLGMIDACDVRHARMHARGDHHGVKRRRLLRSPTVGRCVEPQLDAARSILPAVSSAASRRIRPCPGTARARLIWPPIQSVASNSVTLCPRRLASAAAASPPAPAPTTATLRGFAAGPSSNSVSRQARGLTRQVALRSEKIRSRQAWLQAMQTLILSAFPSRTFLAKYGSASIGRAIETRSLSPVARISSARSGVLMRLDATTGIPTTRFSRAAQSARRARGIGYAMVGTRASCHPIPVLRMSAPAASTRAPGDRSRHRSRRLRHRSIAEIR